MRSVAAGGVLAAAVRASTAVAAVPILPGQKNFTGWWWSSTTREHVGYESWLERSVVMRLDFDPAVVGIASQPFWLHWHDGRRRRRHAPDYFVRMADGSGVAVDVRSDERVDAQAAEAFAATERACDQVGWRFRRMGAADPVMEANLRWLAGYRHPRCSRAEVAARLVEAFTKPRELFAGAQKVGRLEAVLPVLYHLLWCRRLVTELTEPLGPASMVSADGRLR